MHALALSLLIAQSSAGFGADPKAVHDRLATQVAAAYDSAHGGFVGKSQIPAEGAIELALQRAEDPLWIQRATYTMRWMHGLMDTLTGGYVHSGNARDAESGTLDKRADSNGRRLELLTQAWLATKNDAYRRDGARVVDWAERVILDGRGGFVSAQIGDRTLEPAANGPIIHAWLSWASAAREPRRKDFALHSLDRVWDQCWVNRLGLVRKNEMGDIAKEPQLLDQSEMGRAYVLAARLCGRTQDRDRARTLGDLLLDRFQEASGGFRTQSMPSKNGSIKKARSLAGENARAVRFLCELTELTQDPRYRDAASRATTAFEKEIGKAGLEAADWALAIKASYDPGLPGRADWVAEAKENDPPPRKRSVRFKAGH